VGFLLAAGLSAGRSVAIEQSERRAELIDLIRTRQDHTAALGAQLEGLRAEVDVAQERLAAGVPALRSQVLDVEAAAGLTRVRGPGLAVTFSDGTGVCPTGRAEDCRIQDVDLQLAVNALFAAGAEAVAINGERVVSTTAIRSAGQSILMNYRVLVAPYVLEAIGDPVTMPERFAATQIARDLEVWKEIYGLGFSWEPVDELTVPAYSGSVRLRSATLADEDA
jgi:uncharacterized protein YlxW (UPF0749 family)